MFAHVLFANTANCEIWASGPHVRIDRVSEDHSNLKFSSPDSIHWSRGTIDGWNTMRELENVSTMKAVHSGVKRSVKSLRAVSLLESVQLPEAEKPNYPKVPDIKRDEEIRGQSWAIMAIVGDEAFEIRKRQILDTLGDQFFEMIRAHTIGSADHDEDSLQLIFENLREKEDLLNAFHEKYTKKAKTELQNLIQEPQIAIFGFGEDPESLKEKAKTLAELGALKHASIAVVRMYSWLNLNFVESHKIDHTSRLPIADSFFKAMRLAKKE
jgi:hypothetical protein